ncbi:zeta toxin family protein [Streptomyces sp. NPDC048297]|uniref:zeta toxin family protein n=1 Tax=Streptomyces sp. NPDC048297 TaxID=3365531 RepID=UPI003717FE6D
MTPARPEAALSPEYQGLYRELQRRMGPGGDLSPGDHDTFGQYRRGVLWEPGRELLHAAILEDFRQRRAGLPRDGHAALLTAGAPGAGKGGALRGLAEWQGRDDELGRALAGVHGIDVRDYVVLDPDEFKVALFEHGGGPELPPSAYELPGGLRLSPSETASLTHRESAYLQGVFEQWARAEGYNLLYDATLRDQHWNVKLLGDLRADGYDKRVLLSVEVPLDQCLAQNAGRWQHGRAAFDAGRDWYGGRMAPEGLIQDLYARSTTGRGHSIGRENAEKLVSGGLATGLITSDRGTFPARASTPGTAAQSFQQGDAVVRIAAAGRLRSPSATGTGTGTGKGVGTGTGAGPGASAARTTTPGAKAPVVPPPSAGKPRTR